MDDRWVATADEAKVKEGSYLAVYPQGVNVLLVRTGGAVYALANKCAHMACPLEGGALVEHVLTCPCHDWRFDVRTGEFLDAPEIAVTTYPIRIDDGKVVVNLAGVA